MAESDLAGTLKSEYVFFDGERVARRDLAAPASVFYYFSDHLKTASVIADATGNIKAESDYYPWGGELQFVNNDSNHYKFTGKERDAETQLDYFGARYYSNVLGRFITPDWAAKAAAVPYAEFSDPQSLNLYSYVRNIPTTRYDLDGHDLAPGVQWAIDFSVNVIDTGIRILHAISSGRGVNHSFGNCKCGGGNQSGNGQRSNNNSSQRSSTEQGRGADGKFTSKQPGQSAPGAAAEKKGLDSVGAVKNTEKLNGTIRDGTIPETGQHVEVKSGASLNDTKQLRNMGQSAVDATGKPLKVVTTNPDVKVSGPALENKKLQIEPLKKE